MPLLNGRTFTKVKPPADLRPDEEVFFSPVTLEVFRDYDEYFARTILVNSITWNCSLCGQGPTTYLEAVNCEKSHSRELGLLGSSLACAVLYIVSQVHKKRLPDLVESVWNFVGVRFFVGELIEFVHPCSNEIVPGYIHHVTSPKQTPDSASKLTCKDDPSYDDRAIFQYTYYVQQTSQSDGKGFHIPVGSPMSVPMRLISRRRRDILSRDRIKSFIHQTCQLDNGYFVPQVAMLKFYRIAPYGPITWTNLFTLPEPNWSELNPFPRSKKIIDQINRPLEKIKQPDYSGRFVAKFVTNMPNQGGPASAYPNMPGSSSAVSNRSILSIPNGECSQMMHNLPGHTYLSKPSYHPGLSGLSYSNDLFHGNPNDLAYFRGASMDGNSFRSYGMSTNQSMHHLDPERILKLERQEYEREWVMVRRREDLELPDLVVLPEFKKFPSRLAPEDLGAAFQLVEFFHVFGSYLGLVIPQKPKFGESTRIPIFCKPDDDDSEPCLSFSMLEFSLMNPDPCGPLADLFISLLSTVRRLELDINSRQPTPTALAVSYAAAAAVAEVEAGILPTTSRNSQTSNSNLASAPEYSSTICDEPSTCAEYGSLIRVLRDAASSSRLCELVGIPVQTMSSAAGKAALAANAIFSTNKDETTTNPSNTAPVVHRNSFAKAATMAVAAGAVSLPPLDRAGLSEALWLHFTSAAAKGGGWRGQIWGGTRPQDDPCVILNRDNPGLMDKLRRNSVYLLSAHENLLLLTTLMDELLMEPQLRDRLEDNFERLRNLRIQLRSVQLERLQHTNQIPDTDTSDDAQSKSSQIQQSVQQLSSDSTADPSSCSSNTSTISANSSMRGRGLPRGRPRINRPSFVTTSRPVGRRPSNISGSSSSCLDLGSKTDNSTTSKTDESNESTKEPNPNLSKTKLDESLAEEQKLWSSIIETCRGCSMIPLGQDRFYRRYWLVMSIPCILIEDSPSVDNPPLSNLSIRNRQIVNTCPNLASAMGLNSADDAALRTRKFIASWQETHENNELWNRDDLLHRMVAAVPELPNKQTPTLEQLKGLCKPERVRPSEMQQHNACAAVNQLRKFYGQDSCRSRRPTVWTIITPDKNPPPPSSLSPSHSTNQTEKHSDIISSTDDELVQTEHTTMKDFKPDNPDANRVHKPSENLSNELPTLLDRATWTIDRLESSLNPRGVREARLRKTICELRTILIHVVSQCPAELMQSGMDTKSSLSVGTEDTIVKQEPETTESATKSSIACHTRIDPAHVQPILFSWLETALIGMAARLGRLDVLKPILLSCPPMSDICASTRTDEMATIVSNSSDQLSETCGADDCHTVLHGGPDKPEELKYQTTETSIAPDNPSIQPDNCSNNPMDSAQRLQFLSKVLLTLGHSISPRGLVGPLSNDEKTLRNESSSANLPQSISNESDPLSSVQTDPIDSTLNSNGDANNLVQQSITSLKTTTGWQRWCSYVEQAISTSQLHLLARALERGARRADFGGRGVSASVSAYLADHPLPPLKCTVCRASPDAVPTGTSNVTQYAFSVCSGCGCPHHLDCLLTINSRRCMSRRISRPKNLDHTIITHFNHHALPANFDVSMTGHFSAQTALSSLSSARFEVTGASLVLCSLCLRSAQLLPPFSESPMVTGTEQFNMGSSARELYTALRVFRSDESGRDRTADTLTNSEIAKSKRKFGRSSHKPSSSNSTDSNEPNDQQHQIRDAEESCSSESGPHSPSSNSCAVSLSHVSQTSNHPISTSRRRSEHKQQRGQQQQTVSVRCSSRRLGRSTMRSEQAEHEKPVSDGDDDDVGRGGDDDDEEVEHEIDPISSVSDKLCVQIDLLYDDEVQRLMEPGQKWPSTGCRFMDRSRTQNQLQSSPQSTHEDDISNANTPRTSVRLKRASVILSDCDPVTNHSEIVISDTTSTNRSRNRKRSSIGLKTNSNTTAATITTTTSTPDPVQSDSKSQPNRSDSNGLDQLMAEKFLNDLCSLGSARPLLRCGLGRSLALSELNQSNLGDNTNVSSSSSSIKDLSGFKSSYSGGPRPRPFDSTNPHRTRSITASNLTDPMTIDSGPLYALDLAGLQELLVRRELPLGPGQVVSQLRILLSHWIRSNRPGSRLHQCAVDLTEQMNRKLKDLIPSFECPKEPVLADPNPYKRKRTA